MIYYTCCDGSDGTMRTLSESDIIAEYWQYWYGRMCEKYGKEHVDQNFTHKDCIDDWVIIHWAWETIK